MDIQFWIWVIIIVITLIARARKQKAPPPPPPQDETWDQEKPSSRPLTFEELLKEIQAAKEIQRPVAEPIRPYRQPEAEPEATVYKEVDYDDDIAEEEQDLETVNSEIEERKSVDVYEKAKQEAFFRPSLEETMKLEDTVIRFGQFKEYESHSEAAPMASFFAEIKTPEGFRKAFIMSEILTRKF